MSSRKRVSNARKQLRNHAQFTWTRGHWISLGVATAVVLALIGVGTLGRSQDTSSVQAAPTSASASSSSDLKLDSPMAAVRTQLELLQSGRDSDFRETFLPYIRDIMTSSTIAACRDHITNSAVKPAWDRAREEPDAEGRPTTHVAIDHTEVGFHRVDGRWLADYVWCKPAGS